jgi:hypothetical protein
MAWLKRNLGLAIGGAIALALMAIAGWFLWTKIQAERDVTTQLEEATTKFTELLNRPVHPGNDKVNNVENAKVEHARLQEFLAKLKGQIVSPDIPKDLSNRDFRAMLDNTITELQRDADKVGMTLPSSTGSPLTGAAAKDYWFTFASQKTAVEFKNLENLTYALMDVKAICEILYAAKVHDLVGLKRVPASTDETGADFITDKKASTNDYTVVTPYEVTFQAFSSELARVMEGFINSKRCFVIKSVAMDKASSTGQPTQQYMPMPGMERYGGRYGGRYGRAPMPPPVATAPVAPARGPSVLLDENKLRFTLQVDAVRLKPEPAAARGRQQAQAQAQPLAAQ